jgi:hypothetical protein
MALPVGAKAFNVIREDSSTVFMNTVPSATADNINLISNILFNESYQPQLNEFVSNLINRIALTIIRNKSFNNPLAMFKKGSVPLGTDIQDIYENPAKAEAYELSNTGMAKLLTITDPDTHVAYYRRNRQDLYTKTIAREALQGAFVSWDKFEEFIQGITTSLYSGNYIDEFKYTKDLIDGAYNQGKVITKVMSKPVDEATGKAFLKELRALYTKMSLPSTEYNAYSVMSGSDKPVTTWTDKERMVLIVTADVMASIDVDTLAGIFQLSRGDILQRTIVVDKFANDEILGVVCDEAWLQIYDNLLRFDEFYNARVMAWNEYLHAWNTFAICPFANAVVLATETPIPATAIALPSTESMVVGTDETLTLTLTPANATSDIEFSSSDKTVLTVSKVSNTSVSVHPVAAGTAKVNAVSENGKKSSCTVTVTNS